MKITYTLPDIPQIADSIVPELTMNTVLFYGAMGVGKTTLIKALAKRMGINDTITSPTFSIVNEYANDNTTLYHFDCYRLNTEEEALDIGITEYLEANAYSFIEWPDKIAGLLPASYIKIELTSDGNSSRTLTLEHVK